MTSKPQQPRRPPIGFWFKWHFWNQWVPLIEMSYRLPYSEIFHFSYLLAASEAGCWKFEKWKFSKCTVEWAICLTLILKSAQARCVVNVLYLSLRSTFTTQFVRHLGKNLACSMTRAKDFEKFHTLLTIFKSFKEYLILNKRNIN